MEVCLKAFLTVKMLSMPQLQLDRKEEKESLASKPLHATLFWLEKHLEYKRPFPCKVEIMFLAEMILQEVIVLDILRTGSALKQDNLKSLQVKIKLLLLFF